MMSRRLGFLLAAALLSSTGGCMPKTDGTGTEAPAMASIGNGGGKVTSADGRITVAFPAGALPALTAVTVTPVASPGGGTVGQVFELGPSGTTFEKPVTITFH